MKLYKQFTVNFSNHNLKEGLKENRLWEEKFQLKKIVLHNNKYQICGNNTKIAK